VNIDGRLVATTYGFPSAVHCDPVEKKPLYHFLPGNKSFSIATVGCNLHCLNCQNWELSQCDPENSSAYRMPPEKVVAAAMEANAASIAYTYSEPVVFHEYTLDTAKIARRKNPRNILVTAGYINKAPWKELLAVSDAANINLKEISDDFYRRICGATIRPVLDAIVAADESGIVLNGTKWGGGGWSSQLQRGLFVRLNLAPFRSDRRCGGGILLRGTSSVNALVRGILHLRGLADLALEIV
jgi:pyruvate formate lyase activating enzyme